MCCV